MRKIYNLILTTFILLFVTGLQSFSQAPQAVNYQAVARDAQGNALTGEDVTIRLLLVSDSEASSVYYSESHSINTGPMGVINLNMGEGSVIEGDFETIDWGNTSVYLKVEIDLMDGNGFADMGTSKLLSVPYALHAKSAGDAITGSGSAGNIAYWTDGASLGYLPYIVYGDDESVKIASKEDAGDDDPIFEVKNRDGKVVFGVYQTGVRIYVDEEDAGKGSRAGFAVGGFTRDKGDEIEYLRVDPGSVRIIIDEEKTDEKGTRGGFAVGGFTSHKAGEPLEFLRVDPGFVRINIDDEKQPEKGEGDESKGTRAGFAVGGFTQSKQSGPDYFSLTPASAQFLLDETDLSKGARAGFAVGGFSSAKDGVSDYFNISGASDPEVIDPSQARVLWYPEKNAFLAGQVLVTTPDSVGSYSLSIGYENRAVGEYSQAFGYQTMSAGEYSQAFGFRSRSDGDYSLALGYQSSSQGNYSAAIGKGAISRKDNSFAFGDGAQTSGIDAYAFGSGAIASGAGSYAIGSVERDTVTFEPTGVYTEASGDYSFAVGLGSLATNKLAVSVGNRSIASGESSVALGSHASAEGRFATSIGYQTQAMNWATAIGIRSVAEGGSSFSAGLSSKTTASGAVAIGSFNNAHGNYSTAIGHRSTADGWASVAIGRNANALTGHDFAFGAHVIADGGNSFAFGRLASTDGKEGSFVFNSTGAKDELKPSASFEMNFKAYNGFRFFADADTSSSSAFVIKHGARIGLGTKSPDNEARLHIIGGNILLEQGSIIVDGTAINVPDYVFGDGYELKSIEEHASFMWQEKHLPSLKGESVIKEEGYNIIERIEGIVEELEKAHIYIEQLHERIKMLEAEAEGLRQSGN